MNKSNDHKIVARAFSVCEKNGITVYPIYNKNRRTINGKVYEANNWFIEVNNNGSKTIYNKSIGTGSVLGTKTTEKRKSKTEANVEWSVAIENTLLYWEKLIIKQVENEKTK